MQIRLIKKKEGIKRAISKTYKVINLLTREDSKNISFAISKAKNHFEITKNIRSDRIYYILEGKLIVKQNNREFVAQGGEILFIPKNTKYQFEGTFKAILINSPAFNPKDEKIIKID